MKILILCGSGRKNGSTAALAARFQSDFNAHWKEGKAEWETVYLPHAPIKPCLGCRSCFDRGVETCPHKDDIPALREKLLAADAVVAATPVYVDDVSGAFKNLIDRTAYACHRPAFMKKGVFLLATTGGSPMGHAFHTLQVAFMTWGFQLLGQLGIIAGASLGRSDMESRYGKQITAAARSFAGSLAGRSYNRPNFIALMMFAIQQKTWSGTDKDTLDYRYWKENGWLDNKTTYYFEHEANPVLTALARLTGKVIARIFA